MNALTSIVWILQLRHTSVTDLPTMGIDSKPLGASASNGDIQMASGLGQKGARSIDFYLALD